MTEVLNQWHAELSLSFSLQNATRSILARRHHKGPLLIQKALYPEGPEICHVTILHPPSGIAGGDVLDIRVHVDHGAHAVLANTGATRWYKANGRESVQTVTLDVSAHSKLEWLPCENIFFEESNAKNTTIVNLSADATAIGWDYFQLGSVLREGHWKAGHLRTTTELWIEGQVFWIDTGELSAADPLRNSMNGLASFPVSGTLWAFGHELSHESYEQLAQGMPWSEQIRAGVSKLEYSATHNLYLIRVLAQHAEDVKHFLIEAWQQLRPLMLNTPANHLRLWNT